MKPLYKNAPLVNATFEARFHGDLAVESKRYQFQRSVKREFPKLFVPNAAPGKAPALQHCQFRKDDESAIISLAVNSFAFGTSKYQGFKSFKADLEKVWKSFSRLFGIPTFTRVGLRYINHLPIIRDERGLIPLSKYAKDRIKIIKNVPTDKIQNLVIDVSSEMAGGVMRFLLQNGTQIAGLEVLILDLDFYRIGPVHKEERVRFIETAHNQIEKVFFDFISEEQEEIIKGERR